MNDAEQLLLKALKKCCIKWEKEGLLKKPPIIHSGFSPNMWVEQHPDDKAKNFLKRFGDVRKEEA